ncbi:hypothetical protein D9M68_544130 [compost metagenome]
MSFAQRGLNDSVWYQRAENDCNASQYPLTALDVSQCRHDVVAKAARTDKGSDHYHRQTHNNGLVDP